MSARVSLRSYGVVAVLFVVAVLAVTADPALACDPDPSDWEAGIAACQEWQRELSRQEWMRRLLWVFGLGGAAIPATVVWRRLRR